MKFALATLGSRGDVEPYAAVGRELQRRGHEVRIVVPPDYLGFVESAGLAAVVHGPNLVRKFGKMPNPLSMMWEIWRDATQSWPELGTALTSLADGADLLLTDPTEHGLAANVAEYYDIPLAALHFSSATTAASPAAVTARAIPSPAHSSTASAAARNTEMMVPGTSRPPIEVMTRSTPRRSAAARVTASISGNSPPESAAAPAVTSAIPRRIWDRITPELPRAPFSAPVDRAPATRATQPAPPSTVARAFASAKAERMVNSMLAPVSESATGKTLSRLISSMCVIRSLTAVWAQSRRATA